MAILTHWLLLLDDGKMQANASLDVILAWHVYTCIAALQIWGDSRTKFVDVMSWVSGSVVNWRVTSNAK